MICLADISDRTFTIIDRYDPACTQVPNVSDGIKTVLQSVTKRARKSYEGYLGVESHCLE